MDPCTEGATDLVVAIFRLATADYLGREYGHDEVGRPRAVQPHHRADAEAFLCGPWAACLGDWINLSSTSVFGRAVETSGSSAQGSTQHG
jgi:hypothetical protein